MFRDVIINTYEIIFITSDGTEFTIPRYTNVRIYFDIANDETGILPGREIVVNYTLENATEDTFVTASSDGLYTARVEADDLSQGRIYVKAPYKSEYGHINVLVSDGRTYSFVKVINFYEHKMEFPEGMEYYVSSHGGEIQIPFSTNFQYRFEVEGYAEEWISIDYHETRSEMRDGILTVNVAMNEYEYARMARIWVIPTNSTGDVYAEIIINQSSAYFSIDQSKYAVPVEGATLTTHITSSRGLKLHIPSDAGIWLTSSIEDHGGDEYTVTTVIFENKTASIRSATVDLYSGDDSIYLGALEFVQSSPLEEEISDMIFTVRANWSNDFTAILPIAGYYDCYIDWGDGQAEYIFGGDEWAEHENAGISHRYDVQSPTAFTVRISGTVTSLDSEGIKAPCITEVVQWGKTNLSHISGAFWGNYLLEKVCADPFNALGNIGNLDHIFYRCSSLETIPEGIFDKCVNAYSAYSTFQECTGLKEIPENLFKNCKNLTYMDHTFYNCKGLTAIPENLFAENQNLINLTYVFNGCSNIKSIPSGLFNHNHALESLNGMFYNCDDITSIPEDLFYNTVSVRSFDGTFYDCDSLTTIPEGLFRNNIDVTNFNGTFQNCRALKTVPVGIFDNNRKVTEFNGTFGWCYELTGESPYTIIDGVKYHLYERELNPDHFVKPASYEYCFAECRYLIEWESMERSRWFNNWQ